MDSSSFECFVRLWIDSIQFELFCIISYCSVSTWKTTVETLDWYGRGLNSFLKDNCIRFASRATRAPTARPRTAHHATVPDIRFVFRVTRNNGLTHGAPRNTVPDFVSHQFTRLICTIYFVYINFVHIRKPLLPHRPDRNYCNDWNTIITDHHLSISTSLSYISWRCRPR